jgi:hypothetical protein
MLYTIKKGKHSCWYIPSFSWKKFRIYRIKFYTGPKYFSTFDENQEDINKICGFSDSWHHHIHSVRIGWYYEPKTDLNRLVIYSYQNRKRIIKTLGSFKVGEYIDIEIEIFKDSYLIKRNDTGIVQILTRASRWWGPRYNLFPYFGGQERADKDYRIEILKN